MLQAKSNYRTVIRPTVPRFSWRGDWIGNSPSGIFNPSFHGTLALINPVKNGKVTRLCLTLKKPLLAFTPLLLTQMTPEDVSTWGNI